MLSCRYIVVSGKPSKLVTYCIIIDSSQSDSPSIYGLAGLCSLGLLSGDGVLAVAALNELIKCGDSKDAIKLKAVFSSCMSALEVLTLWSLLYHCLSEFSTMRFSLSASY